MKVLIVEDERRAARAIGRMVNQHPSFSVAGMVVNGEEALQFLRTTSVELVITDIRMPIMGGVQLMEQLRQDYPELLVVVLSGYSQFDYAQAAIEHRDFHYLLKPVNQDDLFRILDKAEAHLAAQSQTRLQTLIQAALIGDIPDADTGLRVCPAIVRIEAADDRRSFWDRPEQTAWLQEAFGKTDIVYRGSNRLERLLILDATPSIKEEAERYFRLAAANCVGCLQLLYAQAAVSLEELSALVQMMRHSLSLRQQIFRSNVFSMDPYQPLPQPAGLPLKEMHPERIAEFICTQNRDGLTYALRKLLTTVEEHGSLLADIRACLDAAVNDARIAYQTPASVLNRVKLAIAECTASPTAPEPFLEDLVEILLSLQAADSQKPVEADVIADIVQQLRCNCHMSFSTEMLARQYKLTPMCLNRLFRQHTGMRPAEYLQHVRMERARQMLASQPDALVKDIANSVGYSDPYYFSKLFKRTTGLWPTEYQKNPHACPDSQK